MRTSLLAAAVAGAFLLTGCTGGVEKVGGVAAPATPSSAAAPAPTSSSPVTPEPTTSATAAPTRPVSRPSATRAPATGAVLGPTGYGRLELGMSRSAAEATGMIGPFEEVGDCAWARFPGKVNARVTYTRPVGLAAIFVEGDVGTPEGIRPGSTFAAVKKAYPSWASVSDPGTDEGRGLADVPGNSRAKYRIEVRGGKVARIAIELKDHGCFE